jgi:ribosomal protein S18 acetylase RimI-like enzyme
VTEADRRTRLREQLELYYDAVPRTAARTEDCGPFTLFVGTGAWRYYARPRLGLEGEVTVEDVGAVRARQRGLGVPEQLEWQVELTPSLREACERTGLQVHSHDLMVLRTAPPSLPGPDAAVVRVLGPEDDLGAALAAQSRGFGGDGQVEAGAASFLRERVSDGLSVVVAAEVDGRTVSAGVHQPLGDVSEIVGVATEPEHRGRGLASAVTAELVQHALAHGVRTVFLTAADPAVARLYARLGFERVGTGAVAEPPDPA